jgi:hypothetical protein
VSIANQTRHAGSHVLDDSDSAVQDADTDFTPGQFLRDAGGFVSICLVLGLLMRLLFG